MKGEQICGEFFLRYNDGGNMFRGFRNTEVKRDERKNGQECIFMQGEKPKEFRA